MNLHLLLHRSDRRPSPSLARARLAVPFCALLLVAGSPRGGAATVAGVSFDPAWSILSASIESGGYVTAHGTGLHSGTSPSWTVPDSLGTRFQIPTFQPGYSATVPKTGLPGSAVTLGHDANFPQTSQNPRDIIQLGWASGTGIGNGSGSDLAVFEAATSEAFGVRLYNSVSMTWTDWRYTTYEPVYDTPNDATVTLIDFSAFGIGDNVVVTAVQITNLLITDRVNEQLTGTLGRGILDFQGTGGYQPGRWSTGQSAWVPFESHKFDPDIQYVTGLRAPVAASSGYVAAGPLLYPTSPEFVAPTVFAAPAPATAALLLPALIGMRRRSAAFVRRNHREPAMRIDR